MTCWNKGNSHSVGTLEWQMHDLRKDKNHYINIESEDYEVSAIPKANRISLEQAMQSIDCTRIVGYSEPSNLVPTQKEVNVPGGKPFMKSPKAKPGPACIPDAQVTKAKRAIRF